MYQQTSFSQLLQKDKAPEKGTFLQKQFKKGPMLLLGDIEHLNYPESSVISLAVLSLGSLNLADSILKPNEDNGALQAEPLYLGKTALNLDELPTSAGINFYLALITLQYYSQSKGLDELINATTTTQNITFKKTYYDLFYWGNENNKHYYTCNPSVALEQRTFMCMQADWFMRQAYKVFKLEEQLKGILRDSDRLSVRFSSMFSPKDNQKSEIYAMLGEHYLHIAYMETNNCNAFAYFIKKAHEYYTHSSHEVAATKLAKLVERIEHNSYDLWSEVRVQQYEPLKLCGIAGSYYSIDAYEAWRNAFNFAHQKINDQGINSSLHFMEPDSGRTSLEERNSQSSGELLETKDNDSGLTKVGLHQRKRDSKMTVNPLSSSKLST